MKKAKFLSIVLFAIAATTSYGQEEVKVVYPSSATEIAGVDSSTVSKRAEPPVREESEFDPVTPIGQIRAVRDSLTRTEETLEEIRTALKKDDEGLLSSLFPLAKKSADDGAATKSNVKRPTVSAQNSTRSLRRRRTCARLSKLHRRQPRRLRKSGRRVGPTSPYSQFLRSSRSSCWRKSEA